MIIAVFTNIKDERQYLRKWIEYHANLGVNKFILYEDEGSQEHDDIIDDCRKFVDIDLYKDVLKKDNPEFKDITCFKHVWDNYENIDWLIKLDPDEYINIGDEYQDLTGYISEAPEEADQLVLMWKLYNANKFIHKPSNDEYDLMQTYTEEISVSEIDNSFSKNTSKNRYDLSKTFVRYKYFKNRGGRQYFAPNFPHIIFDDTTLEFGNDCNIFINHYITKSFEEFYIRLKDKGEYSKDWSRKLGDFFALNPDMIKDIPLIEKEYNIDIDSFNTKMNI